MTAANYSTLSACNFALVAVLQLMRAVKGWPVTIASTSIPIWVAGLPALSLRSLSGWASQSLRPETSPYSARGY